MWSPPPPTRRLAAAAAEALFEELLELGVEDGVDDGVEGAVDVAQPGDGAHQAGRDVTAQAQSAHRVDHEERRPAEQEAAWQHGIEAEVEAQRRLPVWLIVAGPFRWCQLSCFLKTSLGSHKATT